MQLKPRNQMVTGAFSNIYRDTPRKGDRSRDWAYAKRSKRKPGPCVDVTAAYKAAQV